MTMHESRPVNTNPLGKCDRRIDVPISEALESDQPRVNIQMGIFYAVLGVAYVAAIVFILALLGLSE